jgi:surfactin family lipopeptide synthetase C
VTSLTAPRIEAIYPVSPTQEGMIYHTLRDPEAAYYVQQEGFEFAGDLDITNFERAWQTVIERHAILRTAFNWQDLNRMLQVVLADARISLCKFDWREFSAARQSELFAEFLATDRQLGFDLSAAPLMRLTLIQLGRDKYRFVWTHHHALLDGWSGMLLLKELAAFYLASCRGEVLELPCPRPYADYIEWLRRQDPNAAEAFWRKILQGFTVPTPLPDGLCLCEPTMQLGRGEERFQFSKKLSASLQQFVRREQITLNTVLQGAWAILLSKHLGTSDVLFGTVTAPSRVAGH